MGAAAAAGLVIGVGVGTFFNLFDSLRTERSRTAVAQPAPQPTEVEQPVIILEPAVDAYDQFLQELELAGDQPYTAELVALDELTPHVRPIRTGLR